MCHGELLNELDPWLCASKITPKPLFLQMNVHEFEESIDPPDGSD
jgi:hypothetical protein